MLFTLPPSQDIINDTILYDFTDPLQLLRTSHEFVLNQSQFEDIVYYIFENMQYDLTEVIAAVVVWQQDQSKKSSNFDNVDIFTIEKIQSVMMGVVIDLHRQLKNMNFFDFNNTGTNSFPVVLNGIVGYNVVLIKDNIISSNQIDLFGA